MDDVHIVDICTPAALHFGQILGALAAGKDSPSDGVAYIQEQFSMTLTKGNFSTLKSQIKKASGT